MASITQPGSGCTDHQMRHLQRKWLKTLKKELTQNKRMRDLKIWSEYKSADRLPR